MKFNILIVTNKISHGIRPVYLRTVYLWLCLSLRVSLIKLYHPIRLRKHAFSVVVSVLHNYISHIHTQTPTLMMFKKLLKISLFSQALWQENGWATVNRGFWGCLFVFRPPVICVLYSFYLFILNSKLWIINKILDRINLEFLWKCILAIFYLYIGYIIQSLSS